MILPAVFLIMSAGAQADEAKGVDVLDGEFWRTQVLEEFIPLWYDHVRDEEHGAFYMNLARHWQPQPPWDKVPAMISRQVFSFSAAYLLSGEEKYLEVAREGAEYLLEHAWDREYGGWFDKLTQTGAPADTTKSVPLQLYTNVGLTLYYFTTGDERVLSHIMKSIEIRQTRAHDEEFGGYYQVLNRDLSVKDDGKNKHSHFGYVGSLLLPLYLATRDAGILQFEKHLTDLTLERMMDSEEGWVYGAASNFDRRWRRTPFELEGVEMAHMGAQLTAALSFLRLYHQTGDERYRERGEALAEITTRWGWDSDRGGWLSLVERSVPHRAGGRPEISWWIQIYGSLMQLQLYRITGDELYLDRFRRSESFYLQHFIDPDHGGVFSGVSPEGALVGDGRKASVWHTSYHDIEHGLLNYLYLNLYVNQRPAVLHFKLSGGEGERKHFVSLVDDPVVEVAKVKIDGRIWTAFNARERSVTLPPGEDLRVEVTLRPGR